MIEHLLMVRWYVGSIPHDAPIELFLILASGSTTGVIKSVVCVILSVG